MDHRTLIELYDYYMTKRSLRAKRESKASKPRFLPTPTKNATKNTEGMYKQVNETVKQL